MSSPQHNYDRLSGSHNEEGSHLLSNSQEGLSHLSTESKNNEDTLAGGRCTMVYFLIA